MGGKFCSIRMDSQEESKYSYWENLLGSNITIYVHKTKDEICLTVPMGTARALTSQFFGWICVLCIIVSVYNGCRALQVKVPENAGMIQANHQVTEVVAMDDSIFSPSTTPAVAITENYWGTGATDVVKGRVVESSDCAEATVPVASSMPITIEAHTHTNANVSAVYAQSNSHNMSAGANPVLRY